MPPTNVESSHRGVCRLRLATFNIKNLNANLLAVQDMLKIIDIMAILEHWLYNYEQKLFNTIDPSFSNFVRSVDDLHPISPYQKPRGFGGTAFMWRKSLDDKISELPDGDEKVMCIEVNVLAQKLCLICAYLPCRGGAMNCEQAYQEALDSIREIYIKYCDTHTIILMGDLNGSIKRSNPSSRDAALLRACKELKISTEVPKQDTFYHVNGRDSNQSDYILMSCDERHLCQNYATMGYDLIATNVSDHIPVKVEINIKVIPSNRRSKAANNSSVTQPRINWSNIDLDKYQVLTKGSSVHTDHVKDNCDLVFAVENLTATLNKAANDSCLVPPKKPRKSKKGLDIWTPEIAHLAKNNKEKHGVWIDAGSPRSSDHPTLINMKKAKTKFRSAIRRTRALARKRDYDEIMEATKDDKLLFYKLIQKQRSNKLTNTDILVINGNQVVGDDQVMLGFKEHFENLATPQEETDFCDDYKLTSELKEGLLFDLYNSTSHSFPVEPLNLDEIKRIVRSCKNGKAQDGEGISAEHFKYADEGLLKDLMFIINRIMQTKFVPPKLLHGVLTPILKKSKDKKDPANYRGITVTSIIGKLLEKAWLLRANPIIEGNQSRLQRGFTAKCSSINAALLITESIAEAKDTRKPLYITFLDASKAFDVVDHSILMNELHRMGIEGDLWLILKQLYNNPKTSLKWKDACSDQFIVHQGVRQGGASSAPIYKAYTNPLLHQLEAHHQTHKIGTINIPAPTCADDMAIIAHHPSDMQAAIDLVGVYSKNHRYKINPTKSATMVYNTQVKTAVELENSEIPHPDDYTHLGVLRNQTNTINTDDRVQLARRSMYALMGAGMHGKNGLAPQISHHLWMTYVIPRMLYGLEVSSYKLSDLSKLDAFQRKTLRQLQFLPEKPTPCNQGGVSLRCSYEPLVGTQLAKSSQRTDRSHLQFVNLFH